MCGAAINSGRRKTASCSTRVIVLPTLAELDGEREIADVRMAWSAAGLAWWVRVEGKRQLPWCRESRLDESDGLQVWVDTRATTNIHRASRFCHRFAFLPRGGGRSAEEPVADQLLINRATRECSPRACP